MTRPVVRLRKERTFAILTVKAALENQEPSLFSSFNSTMSPPPPSRMMDLSLVRDPAREAIQAMQLVLHLSGETVSELNMGEAPNGDNFNPGKFKVNTTSRAFAIDASSHRGGWLVSFRNCV